MRARHEWREGMQSRSLSTSKKRNFTIQTVDEHMGTVVALHRDVILDQRRRIGAQVKTPYGSGWIGRVRPYGRGQSRTRGMDLKLWQRRASHQPRCPPTSRPATSQGHCRPTGRDQRPTVGCLVQKKTAGVTSEVTNGKITK